jgi:protocatechuate 3,4-dioxygenase beta subunit
MSEAASADDAATATANDGAWRDPAEHQERERRERRRRHVALLAAAALPLALAGLVILEPSVRRPMVGRPSVRRSVGPEMAPASRSAHGDGRGEEATWRHERIPDAGDGAARRRARLTVDVVASSSSAEGVPVAPAQVTVYDGAGHALATGQAVAIDGGAEHGTGRPTADRIVFDTLPEGAVYVVVEREGWARANTVARASAEGGSVRVTLGPQGALYGRVEDDRGTPVAGARLEARLENDDTAPPFEAFTSEDGTFALRGLPREAQLRLEVHAEGFEVTGRRAVLARALEDARGMPQRIVLRRTGTLGGVVREGGVPIEGAEVVLVGSGVWPARSVLSGAGGQYRFDGVPGGVYELRARRGDAVSDPREGVVLEPGANRRDIDLGLAPGAVLRGVVWDEDGDRPVVGAEVLVAEASLSFSPRAVRSGEGGRFEVRGLRRQGHAGQPHRISVRAEGFVPVVGLEARPGEAEARIGLRRAATMTGIVIDTNGEPVRGAQLEVTGTLESGAPVLVGGAGDGFRSALFALQVTGPQALRVAGELGVTSGQVPRIPLVPTLAVTGVEATPPVPLPGGDPSSASSPGWTHGFASGPDGRFRITGVPPGRIQLVARHVRYATAVLPPRLVTAGATVDDVRIVLDEGGWVDGRVVDARGFPVETIRVEYTSEREPHPRALLTGRDGRFEVRGVLGDVWLTAFPPGLPPVRERVTVTRSARADVTLRLEGDLVRLAGRAVDQRGFPVAAARVTVRSLRARTPVTRSTESAGDGTWLFDALPPPPWSVEVDHAEHALARIDRVERAPRELRVVLEAATEVRGTLLDAFTRAPVAGARVVLLPLADGDEADAGGSTSVGAGRALSAEARWTATSGPDGTYAVERVPAGAYRLWATAAGHLDAGAEVTVDDRRGRPRPVELRPLLLERAGEVSGEVLDRLGTPVPGAEVFALRVGGDTVRDRRVGAGAPTDARGRFVLSALPPGDVVLAARHPAVGEVVAASPTRVRAGERTAGVWLRFADRFDPERARDALGEGVRTSLDVLVVDAPEGAVVLREVRAGSAAARAGLRAGDVLRSVDDVDVGDADDARRRLAGPHGTDAVLEVLRSGRTLRVVVPRERVTY